MLIGATRCGVECENTVLLETQGPCESVRECIADTATDDTSARRHFRMISKSKKKTPQAGQSSDEY